MGPDIYNMQSQKNSSVIKQDEILVSKDIKITGLYDPEDFSLDINMWSNSDGEQILRIFKRIAKKEGSGQAAIRKMVREDGSERTLEQLQKLYA